MSRLQTRLTVSLQFLTSLALMAGPAQLFAQESSENGLVLEEVIVTAQKRAQSLLDVPLSITAITDAVMLDTGAAQLSDFLQSAPGVGIIDNQSGTQTIQIRGINSTFGNAPVGYYLDELPFSLVGNTQVPDVRTYDLERVEILRGPQGTLYGDGSIGGTIRILTREPDLESFEASVDLTGSDTEGGDGNFAAKGMLNMPIQEGVAGLRLVLSREEYGGWIDNVVSGEDNQNERDIDNFRGKFRWAPTDRLDMVFSYWHTEEDATGDALARDDQTTVDPAASFDVEYDLYSATVRYSFDSFDLVSATSFMDYSADSLSFVAGLFPFTDLTDQEIFSEELRLTSSGDGNFKWTAGFFYRSMERETVALLPDFGFSQDLNLDSDAFALFGELTWTVLDQKMDVTLGLRYFEDDRKYLEDVDPALVGLIQTIDPSFTGLIEEKFDTTNPRLNLAYRPNDNWTIYGNVAKGFRTGQPQPALSLGLAALFGVSIPSGIDPEEMWSYEVGTKGSFMGGRASLEAAVFYNDWQDLQVPVTVTPQVRALVNGGDARTQGIELSLSFLPMAGLSVQLGGGYTDAHFTEDVAGINIQDGDRIPGVPQATLSAAATYRWPLSGALEGFAHAGVQHASKRSDDLNFATDSDDTTTLDVRLGVEGESWGAYLFAENLTDEDGALNVYFLGPAGPATRYRPRTLGVQFRASF